MIKINKILTPIDFDVRRKGILNIDEPGLKALKYGCELANRFDAELHILHVVHNVTEIEICTHESENVERDTLKDLVIKLANPKVAVFKGIRKGRPFVEIIKYAKEKAIDLIVLGTHGHNPLPHVLIGGEVEKVVSKAPCPVLVVRHPEHEFVMP